MHVITLTVEDQITICYLTRNYLKLLARTYLQIKDQSLWTKYCKAMDKCDSITNHMSSIYTQSPRKVMLYFPPEDVRAMLKILDQTEILDQTDDVLQIIEDTQPELLRKLTECAKYTFTKEEVQAALRQA